ncbi:hypothetical protein BDV96DRAFT_57001 [Lophiotrema nucula]|uniref:F-box domain-containing protein n=1 Tax=Lophiotrema nucula TaxID=690887 RepID=A0A6A5ZAU5_9PLEO|nr:hypothetical protein BDV96DRAFT_57001 [Lophiotrema nucula]
MSNGKSSHFMKLPLELRQEVYRHYFEDAQGPVAVQDWPTINLERSDLRTQYQHRRFSHTKKPPPFFPNLCFANRQVGKEAAEYLIKIADWTINSPKVATASMRALGALLNGDLFKAIRKLSFPEFYWHHYGIVRPSQQELDIARLSPYTRLIDLASNLRVLQLSFHTHSVTYEENWQRDTAKMRSAGYRERRLPLPLSEFIEDFQLYPVAKCRHLQQFVLDGRAWGTTHQAEVEGDDFQTLVEFGIWVKTEIGKVGGDVEVTLNRWRGTWSGSVPICDDLVGSVVL